MNDGVMRWFVLLFAMVLATPCLGAAPGIDYAKRVDFGRKLEPKGNRILTGAGQDANAFWYHAMAVRKTPAIYMAYAGLDSDPEDFFASLESELNNYDELVMPQIGLCMTVDGSPDRHYEDKVAAGLYDGNIETFVRGLKDLKRPAFVRIGYEFNGPWNGYRPSTYKAAWKRIVDISRRMGLRNVAFIWNYAPGNWGSNFMDYYPGDAYVDWWSLDIFDIGAIYSVHTHEFLELAQVHGFPVLIGESTPQKVGVLDGADSWSRWFEPYFRFIAENPVIKGFCYINWRWDKYEQWADWGDARLEANPTVRVNYRTEVSKPVFVHGLGLDGLKKLLYMDR